MIGIATTGNDMDVKTHVKKYHRAVGTEGRSGIRGGRDDFSITVISPSFD